MDPMTTDDAVAHIEAIIRRWLVSSPSRADAHRMATTLETEGTALSRVVEAFPQPGQKFAA